MKAQTFDKTISAIIPESQPVNRGGAAIKNFSFRERERKGPLVSQVHTKSGSNEPISRVTKRLAGRPGSPGSPLPQQLCHNKKKLFGKGLEVDMLAVPLLACSNWLRFEAGKLTEHPHCQHVSTVMYCLVWLYLFPSTKF